jgi:dienelactone hydrolase
MRRTSFAGLLVGLLLCTVAGAEPVSSYKDFPARTEIRSFPSLTITDTQFLTGNDQGKEVTLTGELSIAQGQGRLPVVILMHGSGGIGANAEYWRRQFNGMGVSTFIIDGFAGRGLTGVGDNQALLGRLNFILDMYRALDILAKHPRIDPDRVMIMGFSRGGQAALYSSLERFHTLWNKSGVNVAGYIAFYPDCSTTYRDDTGLVKRPIRIFHGTPDNYNPVTSCKTFVERAKKANADIELTEYPKAQHAFDNPLIGKPIVPTKADQSVRDCRIQESDQGELMNQATQVRFSYKDECVRLGPSIGYDPEATEAATIAVRKFVQSVVHATD